MSLFPAYSNEGSGNEENSSRAPKKPTSWLQNNSFPLNTINFGRKADQEKQLNISRSSTNSGSDDGDSEDCTTNIDVLTIANKPKNSVEERANDFDGSEEFYVDRKPALQFRKVTTLHRGARPRYLKHLKKIGLNIAFEEENVKRRSYKRYYDQKQQHNIPTKRSADIIFSEVSFNTQSAELTRKIAETPTELEPLFELLALQERNPYKWSRLVLAEKRLNLIKNALVHHRTNEQLYRLYIDIASVTYPSSVVSTMLDRLLSNDPYNYTLWTGQIMTIQGTMARCNVPNVLCTYERCMKKMHHTQIDTDFIMLKLFHNCALFMRQAGNHEQFIALLKLALELNVSTEQFNNFVPNAEDDQTLIEYEEVVLQSGLPMNEIWLRIEKLRQAFNFLPYPIENNKCNDPQRCVFNEDVCHYIYPLKSNDNLLFLMLLVVHLLKLPFVHTHCLAQRLSARIEQIGDSDAIEMVLAAGLRSSYCLPNQQADMFLCSLYELAKEMAVSPTFVSNCIGHELYTTCVSELLLNCAASYEGTNVNKRKVFILLWCRFERLRLVLEKCCTKFDSAMVKAGRSRFKAMLKKPENRSIADFYIEFALYELEALTETDNINEVCKIFENILKIEKSSGESDTAVCHAHLLYAEILISRNMKARAQQVLLSYALDKDIKSLNASSTIVALERLTQQLDSALEIESSYTNEMPIEWYLLADRTITLLKIRCLLQCLIGQKTTAITYLDQLLSRTLSTSTERNCYIREQIYELYIVLLQLKTSPNDAEFGNSNSAFLKVLSTALREFPRNIYFLQRCGMLSGLPWYKLRGLYLTQSQPNILSIIFLITAGRHRILESHTDAVIETLRKIDGTLFDPYKQELDTIAIRNRLLNIFQTINSETATTLDVRKGNNGTLRRNALFWRFYLRCLSDQRTAFERSKECLLTALDECPWSKALYLDGATYVPPELPHIQDLMIEKQLRVYALPEELEILRE